MSSELASLGPLCQAAILTFKPYSGFFVVSLFFIVAALLVKLVASILKTYFLVEKKVKTNQITNEVSLLANKYNFPQKNLYILDSPQLLAFSSVLPGVANGIFLSKKTINQLSSLQLEAVFLHELYHWKSNQTVLQLILKLLADVLFFLPIIRDILLYWQLQSELEADAFAAQKLKSVTPLKEALHTWIGHQKQTPVWAVAFAEAQLEARIEALTNTKKTPITLLGVSTKSILITSVVVLLLLVFGSTASKNVEATIIIPTNTQCSKIWQKPLNQSAIDSVMSPKLNP